MEARAAGGSQQGTTSAVEEERGRLSLAKTCLLHQYGLGPLSLQPHKHLRQRDTETGRSGGLTSMGLHRVRHD